MESIRGTFAVLPFLLLLSACGSGGEDVNSLFNLKGDEVEVPVDADLSIVITKPDEDGTPTGYLKKLVGTCGTGGVTIRIDMVVGAVNTKGHAFTACNVDETWEVEVDTSTAAVGNITLRATMVNDELEGTAAQVIVNKLSTACDSASARADTFANTSTTGVPPWEICTTIQLTNIGTTYQDDDVTLMNDIDFGDGNYSSQGSTGGSGGYKGTFEGNNFEISNFTINNTTATQQGLFRESTGATFQNMKFDNITINARFYIGVIVGYVEVGDTTFSNIDFDNITLSGKDTGNNGYSGALFGANRNGATNLTVSDITINNITIDAFKDFNGAAIGYINNITSADIDRVSVTTGTINGRNNSGGVIGYMHPTPDQTAFTIDDIYNASANVSCSGSNCGGVVGYANGEFNDLFNTGTVTSTGTGGDFGGLIGEFHDGYIRGSSAAASREAVTMPAIPTSDPPTVDGVTGWPVSCYNTGDVVATTSTVVGGLVGRMGDDTEDINSCYNTGDVAGGTQYVGGLVGYGARFSITDSFNTGDVSGSENYIAGIMGYAVSGTPYMDLDTVYSSGDVTAAGSSPQYVGGIVGRFRSNEDVEDVWYSGNIYVSGDDTGAINYVGGIFGQNDIDGGSCTDCHVAGSIIIDVPTYANAHRYVGGIAGDTRQDSTTLSSTMTITASTTSSVGGIYGRDYRNTFSTGYATGDIVGLRYVGGLIGQTDNTSNTTQDTYATGNITSLISGNNDCYAGGLIGISRGNVYRSYASGDVTAVDCDFVGGLEGGDNSNTNRYLTNSFATGDIDAGTGNNVGGLSGQMRANTLRLVNNFATGDVRGGDYTGGLIGYMVRRGNNAASANYAVGTVTRATGGTGPDNRFSPLMYTNNSTAIDSTSNFYNSDFMPVDEATSMAIASPYLTNLNPMTSAEMADNVNWSTTGNFENFDIDGTNWDIPSGSLILPGHSVNYTYPVHGYIE